MLPEHNNYDMPTSGMTEYRSFKQVRAGRITEVVPAGCYVSEANGDEVLRIYPPKMTERYQPVVGDYWVVYPDGYQAISPRHAFEDGYTPLPSDVPSAFTSPSS